jgi:hypothetical protein
MLGEELPKASNIAAVDSPLTATFPFTAEDHLIHRTRASPAAMVGQA